MNRWFSFFLLIGWLSLYSCNNQQKRKSEQNIDSLFKKLPSGNIKNNFSNTLDTTYQFNSTQIESINRTFFMAGDTFTIATDPYQITENEYIELSKELGKNEYTMIINMDKKIGIEHFSEKGLIKFFADADTVFQNPTKRLQYSLGKDERGAISLVAGKLYLNIFGPESVLRKITRAELDSMKSCFLRFKAEK